jgi:hypothetical protein
MIQLMEERQQHEAAVTEYKQVHTECYDCEWLKFTGLLVDKLGIQVFQRLDEGHQKQQEELSQELLEVKVRQSSHQK